MAADQPKDAGSLERATATVEAERSEIRRLLAEIPEATGRWIALQREVDLSFLEVTRLQTELGEHLAALQTAKLLMVSERERQQVDLYKRTMDA